MKAMVAVLVLISLPCAVRAESDKDDPNVVLLRSIESEVQDAKTAGDIPDATTSKRDVIERDAVKALKASLDGKQITLIFPIKDAQSTSTSVKKTVGEEQVLKLEPPLNLNVDKHALTYRMRLSKDQILKINEDSVLVIRGKISIEYADHPDLGKTLVSWKTARNKAIVLSLHPMKIELVLNKTEKRVPYDSKK